MRNKMIALLLFLTLSLLATEPNYKTVHGSTRTQDQFNKTALQQFSYLFDVTDTNSEVYNVTADTVTTRLTLPRCLLHNLTIVGTDSINDRGATAADSVIVKIWIGATSTLTNATRFAGSGADTTLVLFDRPTEYSPLTVTSKQYLPASSTLKIGWVNTGTHKTFVKGKFRVVGSYSMIE